MAVGRGDAKPALRLKSACGKVQAQGHHSETIIKLFSSIGSQRFKITKWSSVIKNKLGPKDPQTISPTP